jgi:hypothetical protein
MDEVVRTLKTVALLLLLPFAALAAALLVVLVAGCFYLRSFLALVGGVLSPLFGVESPRTTPLGGPHFNERSRNPEEATVSQQP